MICGGFFVKVSIIGATGYTGAELLRILINHPAVEIKYITSESSTNEDICQIYPHLNGIYHQKLISMEHIDTIASESDVIFIGLPHGHAMGLYSKLSGRQVKVIDLGADYRLNDSSVYEKWYNVKHTDPTNKAVYGLPELYRDKIKESNLVANPGCYVTASILALAPLIKNKLISFKGIIVDAKSGTTGAGRSLSLGMHFPEVFGNFKAYGVCSHRHTPEIEQVYSDLAGEEVLINFTPHLLPIDRGILATCYAELHNGTTKEAIETSFNDFYKDEYFVRVLGKGNFPSLKNIRGSNFVDIGWQIDERTGKIIVVSTLDNLVKGASGQAVQNMNIIFGLQETMGLTSVPLYP